MVHKLNLVTKKVSIATLWEVILGACISINLIQHHALDIFFILFGLLAIVKIKSDNLQTVLKDLNFKNCLLIYLTLSFLIGCSAGYLWFWPLSEEQFSDILQLRWVFGLYLCIYVGKTVGKLPTSFRLASIMPMITILYLIYLQSKYPWGIIDIRTRMFGLYENANHLGMTLALLWGVYLGFIAFTEKVRSKSFLVQIFTLIGISVTLVATYSRSSWLGCGAALLVAIAYSNKKFLKWTAATFLSITLYLALMNSFGLRDRLMSTSFSPNGVESGRIAIWRASWQIFLDHPIFGVGIDQGKRIYHNYYEHMGIPLEYLVGHAHNQYLQLLAGTGLVGFLSYLGIFSLALVYFHKTLRTTSDSNLKQVALAGTLLITALFASSFTDAPFRLHECRNYVLLYLGFAFGYLESKQTRETK